MNLLRLYRFALVLPTVALIAISVAFVRDHQRTTSLMQQAQTRERQLITESYQTKVRLGRAEQRATLWKTAFHEWTKNGIPTPPDYQKQFGGFLIGSVAPKDRERAMECLGLDQGSVGFPGEMVAENGDIYSTHRMAIAVDQAKLLEDAEKRGYVFNLRKIENQ